MLSDSPPERDVIWTEEGVQGAVAIRAAAVATGARGRRVAALADLPRPALSARRRSRCARPPTGALARVSEDVERLRFNVCVAHIYEFANAFQASLASLETEPTADYRWAVREAADILVRLFHPMMPHLAEECWAALGHKTLVAREPGRSSSRSCWSRTPSHFRSKSMARSARMSPSPEMRQMPRLRLPFWRSMR